MITLLAFFMMKAASSADPCFTGRCSAPAAGPATSPPKPPRITEMKLRFMPLHMMEDRMAPDEPTSAPVMMRAEFPGEEATPAAAPPAYDVSSETTDGLAAPP